MRQAPLYTVSGLFEMAYGVLLPILTILFFSNTSPFHGTAHLALYYGLTLGLIRWGGLFANSVLIVVADQKTRRAALQLSALGLLFLGALPIASLAWKMPALIVGGGLLYGLLDTHKPTALAVLMDSDRQRTVRMGRLQSAFAMGACLGPILGGHLTHQHTWPFVGVMLCAMLIFGITQKQHATAVTNPTPFRQQLAASKTLLKNKTIVFYLLLLICNQIAWSSYYEFIAPLLKTNLNWGATTLGYFLGAIALTLIGAAIFVLPILKRFTLHFQISASILCIGLILSITFNVVMLWLGAIFIAAGDVMFYSLLSEKLGEALPESQRAQGYGLAFIVISLIWGGMAIVGGTMYHQYHDAILWFAICFSSLLFLLSWRRV